MFSGNPLIRIIFFPGLTYFAPFFLFLNVIAVVGEVLSRSDTLCKAVKPDVNRGWQPEEAKLPGMLTDSDGIIDG